MQRKILRVCVVRLLLWVFGGGGARKFSTCRSNFAPGCGMRACDDASNECVEETRSSIIIFVRAALLSHSRHCFEVYAVSRSIIMILSFFLSLRDCQLFVSVVCVCGVCTTRFHVIAFGFFRPLCTFNRLIHVRCILLYEMLHIKVRAQFCTCGYACAKESRRHCTFI